MGFNINKRTWADELTAYGRKVVVSTLSGWLIHEPHGKYTRKNLGSMVKACLDDKACYRAGKHMKAGVHADDGFSSWGLEAPDVPPEGYMPPDAVMLVLSVFQGRYAYDWLLEGSSGLWGGRVWDNKLKKEVPNTRFKGKYRGQVANACMAKLTKRAMAILDKAKKSK